ncbi:hypothetical protein CASFOL_029606 [Castilleja foliolosa]|uniref:Fe2OG dioxygenase domain-containing protein n=1 Tax=Castilleja foliolosa TaxID=1961234 RepID=A0ABD3CBG8_9LAMI
MPPAAVVDRIPAKPMAAQQLPPPIKAAATSASEVFAKDAIIAWFRGEFAAANAIIDALCYHVVQLEAGGDGREVYESALAAIHQRRLNWIPILQMQKYYSIADVMLELKNVAETKREKSDSVDAKATEELKNGGCTPPAIREKEGEKGGNLESNDEIGGDGGGETSDESPQSEITDSGSQETRTFPEEHIDICCNHGECEARGSQIKMTKGFVAKEPVKGHMVNVVRGLKLYEDIFTDVELSKLNDFVNELRVAGLNGELSGETFILYNQQVKGNKRELIQLGVPIFGQIQKDQKGKIEQIPSLLHGVIEHLTQWRLIPESRKPTSCIINFFDEGEYSQPFLKPPHLDQPLSTLLLSESTMAFGRTLSNDTEGNYRAPLTLSLKKGSLLVMRGNSSDTARHAMCSSLNKRVSITFFRVRNLKTEKENNIPETITPLSSTMTSWQPTPYTTRKNYGQVDIIPKWGFLRSPVVMLAPIRPMTGNPRRTQSGGGTGVFLPWTVGSRKPARHLPPRAQRQREAEIQ